MQIFFNKICFSHKNVVSLHTNMVNGVQHAIAAKSGRILDKSRAQVGAKPNPYHRITVRYPYDNRRITP